MSLNYLSFLNNHDKDKMMMMKRSSVRIFMFLLVLLLLSSMIPSVTCRSHIQLHKEFEEWKPSSYPRVKAKTAIFFMGDSTTERVYKYGMLGMLMLFILSAVHSFIHIFIRSYVPIYLQLSFHSIYCVSSFEQLASYQS